MSHASRLSGSGFDFFYHIMDVPLTKLNRKTPKFILFVTFIEKKLQKCNPFNIFAV